MTTRAYIRESTVAQGDKFGPDAQRAAIDRACADLAIPAPSHWYTDLITGTGKTVRDSLAHARADAAAHVYDVLVCYDTSRWARNEREAFDFEHEMKLAGVRVYYAAERIWADDESKALHKGMLHVINAEYSRALSRRVRDGMAAKRAKGGHIGGVPYGYRRSADLMRIEPTADVAVRILAWELYAQGDHTYATVAAELNRRGHRILWRGVERAFVWTTIAEFFKSDVDVRVGGLDPDVFDRANAARARHRLNEHVGQRRHRYVFAGLARCADCGEGFWGRMNHQAGKRAYRQLQHAPRGCRHGSRNEESLELQIGRWLATWKLPADAAAKVARFMAREQAPTTASERRAIETELERLRNLYRWGDLREDEYQREKGRLQSALAALGPERVARPVSVDAVRMIARLGDAWMAATDDARRVLALAVFSELRLHRDGSIDIVPASAVRELVFCAASATMGPGAMRQSVGIVGTAPRSPTEPPYRRRSREVRLVGIDEWRDFWTAEASA